MARIAIWGSEIKNELSNKRITQHIRQPHSEGSLRQRAEADLESCTKILFACRVSRVSRFDHPKYDQYLNYQMVKLEEVWFDLRYMNWNFD